MYKKFISIAAILIATSAAAQNIPNALLNNASDFKKINRESTFTVPRSALEARGVGTPPGMAASHNSNIDDEELRKVLRLQTDTLVGMNKKLEQMEARLNALEAKDKK